MALLERILAIGITGSGKTWQWLQIARAVKKTGAKFRVIDTDNDVDFMLNTQFEDLLPENGGNVYVHPAFDWPEYKQGVKWITNKLTPQQLSNMDDYLVKVYKTPIKSNDWVIVDKINNAWSTVQRYFVDEVFGDDMGEYFLEVRKEIQKRGGLGKSGKQATSTVLEGMDGWKDWIVINRLYEDWVLPIIYRVPCHVYSATDVDELDKKEKDPEILSLFGELRIKPSGQKKLGGQFHTIFLLIPGKNRWLISTVKDRSGRKYFEKVVVHDLFMQYLVARAGWQI